MLVKDVYMSNLFWNKSVITPFEYKKHSNDLFLRDIMTLIQCLDQSYIHQVIC